MLLVVWATKQALTTRNVRFPELKWRYTSLMFFSCEMSAECPLNLSFKVFPDCPTYCSPHFRQLVTYMKFLAWQEKHPLILNSCFIFQEVILVFLTNKDKSRMVYCKDFIFGKFGVGFY